MASEFSYKKRSSVSKNYRKQNPKDENTLDNYISKTSSGINWWNEDDIDALDSVDNSKKYEFLKKNIKPSSVIPSTLKKVDEAPDKLGSFTFPGGTLEVGYEKFPKSKSEPIVFSLVPDVQEDKKKIDTKRFDDHSNYFGGVSARGNNHFTASVITVKSSRNSTKNVEKLEDDNDGIPDSENKLLYQDKKENDAIRNLKELRDDSGSDFKKYDKAIAKINVIKEEKKEDNLAFLKAIDNFMDKLRRGKLRKYVDSDEFIVRRKRIIELSSKPDLSSLDLAQLKRLLEELLQKSGLKKWPDLFSKLDVNKLEKEEIEKFVNYLTEKLTGDSV